MKIIDSIVEMQALAQSLRVSWKTIGFVPTMGYLHDGHLALVEKARAKADVVTASIYVNPTQFAPGEDLDRYPRDPEGDQRKLESAGCDVLFMPRSEEIYPSGFGTYVTVGGLSERFEGAFRPEHFRGVATVVAKLFNIVQPQVAVFGQKDAQQVAVIRRMIADLNFDVRLVVGETVREASGLAMSSRNVYLSDADRAEAVTISRALFAARDAVSGGGSLEEARHAMRRELSPAIALDYAEIVDADTFDAAGEDARAPLAIVAGRVGRTRLIDNLPLMRAGA
jgi:pantoate--beta-alanine ligase